MVNSDFSHGEDSLFRLLRQMQDQQNRWREDMKRMQETAALESKWLAENQAALIKDAVETATALRQQVQDAIGLPDSTIQHFQEEQNRWREDMKHVVDMKRMQEAAALESKWLAENQATLMKDAVEAATYLRQLREDQNRWRESLNLTSLLETGGIVGRYRQELQSLSRFVNEIPGILASQFPQIRDSLEIGPDGTISMGSISVSAAEVEENVEELFSHAIGADFLDRFWERLDSYKAPVKAWIIQNFLPALISTIIISWAPMIYKEAKLSLEDYIASVKPNSSQDVKQAIKSFPHDFSILDDLDYRVVALTGRHLMLRENPTTESAIINRLDRGKCVRVIESYNKWSFVEVSIDNSEEIQTGWVYSRYLVKLR